MKPYIRLMYKSCVFFLVIFGLMSSCPAAPAGTPKKDAQQKKSKEADDKELDKVCAQFNNCEVKPTDEQSTQSPPKSKNKNKIPHRNPKNHGSKKTKQTKHSQKSGSKKTIQTKHSQPNHECMSRADIKIDEKQDIVMCHLNPPDKKRKAFQGFWIGSVIHGAEKVKTHHEYCLYDARKITYGRLLEMYGTAKVSCKDIPANALFAIAQINPKTAQNTPILVIGKEDNPQYFEYKGPMSEQDKLMLLSQCPKPPEKQKTENKIDGLLAEMQAVGWIDYCGDKIKQLYVQSLKNKTPVTARIYNIKKGHAEAHILLSNDSSWFNTFASKDTQAVFNGKLPVILKSCPQ